MSRLKLPDLAFLAAATPAAAASVVTDGLQLYLDAGNSSSYPGTGTTWTDLSGNSRNATLTGGPTYSSADGGSFYFSGPNSGQYAQMSGTISNLSAGTLFAFAKRDGDLRNYNSIMFQRGSGQNATGLNTGPGPNNGTCLGYHWNNAFGNLTNLNFPNATWCATALTVTSSTLVGYILSPSQTTQTVSGSFGAAGFADLEVAGAQTFADRYFKGNISVAMIYNRALSASEITQNFNAFKARYGY